MVKFFREAMADNINDNKQELEQSKRIDLALKNIAALETEDIPEIDALIAILSSRISLQEGKGHTGSVSAIGRYKTQLGLLQDKKTILENSPVGK